MFVCELLEPEREKSFLLSLSRKATGVGSDFLGNESVLMAFTF